MNLETFETEITPKITKVLSDGEAYRQKCYLASREWQLRKFNIGWTPDWSHAELIHALHKKLQTLRKMAKLTPGSSALIMAPMYRAAYAVEVELAKVAA